MGGGKIKVRKCATSWTHFYDRHSGGGQKDAFAHCYIEAAREEAELIFYNRFGHNPNRVTYICCGGDYFIREYSSLVKATKYQRVYSLCRPAGPAQSLAEYIKRDEVLVIRRKEIKPKERIGTIPAQGFVWVE